MIAEKRPPQKADASKPAHGGYWFLAAGKRDSMAFRRSFISWVRRSIRSRRSVFSVASLDAVAVLAGGSSLSSVSRADFVVDLFWICEICDLMMGTISMLRSLEDSRAWSAGMAEGSPRYPS